jgi:hypothetical protein
MTYMARQRLKYGLQLWTNWFSAFFILHGNAATYSMTQDSYVIWGGEGV